MDTEYDGFPPALAQQMSDMFIKLDNRLEELAQRSHAILEIKTPHGKIVRLKNTILPKCFQDVLDLVNMRENVFLVGPAGCGKTTIASLVSKSLGWEFSAQNMTSGTTEAHLLGRSIPNISKGTSRFRGTEFLNRYENGGIHLLDELDAADSNVMVCLHTAIENDYLYLPDRPENPKAVRHEDFGLVATANTFGRGADRVYSARNQMDEAFLSRWRIGTVTVDYDTILEEALCPLDSLLHTCWDVREKIQSHGLRRVMDTRFIKKAYRMFKGCKWPVAKIMEVYFQGWSAEERQKCYTAPIVEKEVEEGRPAPAEDDELAYKAITPTGPAPFCNRHGTYPMVRMASNKGWRCGVDGNKWHDGRWTICSFARWDK